MPSSVTHQYLRTIRQTLSGVIISGVVALVLVGALVSGLQAQSVEEATGEAATLPRVAFGHFAPLAADPAETVVDIRLNGTVVVTDLMFGTLTPYLEFDAGEYLVEVMRGEPAAPVVSYTLSITTSQVMTTGVVSDTTLAFIGKNATFPLRLLAFEDDNQTLPATGFGRLRLAHLAPISPLLAPSRLDICTEQNAPPLVADLSYTDSETQELPAGIYRTFISSAGGGCRLRLLDLPEFVVRPGEIAYIYAVGDGTTIPPTVVTRPDLRVSYLYLPQVERE